MLISVSYFVLFLLRAWNYQRRRNMLLQAFKKVLTRGVRSVYLQKQTFFTRDSRAGGLIRSDLISGSLAFQETCLLNSGSALMTAITPKQVINLSNWVSYLDMGGAGDTKNDITLLLETSRPDDLSQFLQTQTQVAPADRVHILSCGSLIAWHSGSPFGILLKCNMESLATLMMAYMDDTLSLEEDLEVHTLMTVQTEGKPSSLFQGAEEELVSSNSRGDGDNNRNMESLLASAIGEDRDPQDAQDQMAEMWSNESLASNSSIGRVELLEMSDNDIIDDDESYLQGINESGSGEGLSDYTLEDSNNSASLSQSWKVIKSSAIVKPPNVLVYTGKKDNVRKFEKTKEVLEQCLDSSCYVIYNLKHEDIDTTPWIDNTSLLVIASRKGYDVFSTFIKYLESGGKILSFSPRFDTELVGMKQLRDDHWLNQLTYKTWSDVSLIFGGSVYDTNEVRLGGCRVSSLGKDSEGNDTIVKVCTRSKEGSGCAILSQVLFNKDAGDLGVTPEIFNTLKKSNAARFEILQHMLTLLGLECSPQSPPTLTPAALLTKTQDLKSSFMKSIQNRLSSGVLKFGGQSLHFMSDSVPVQGNVLPVVTENTEPVCENFQQTRYFENLDCKVLGNTVLYVDVVPTTMTLLDGLMFSAPENTGLVAIARQQTSGKGRGGNSWLSPVGCAMFTLHVRVPLDSTLGSCVSYLQHITSLAVVYSVCKLQGYQDIDLKIKWPNDIYYGKQMKLGGVIVKSSIIEGMVHATIGCGFNVDNSNPTICVNDLIQLLNRQQGTSLAPCSPEQLLGRTVTYIESLIQQFQQEGTERFRQLYYEKWLHSDTEVTLQSEDMTQVTIRGLDDFGYLLVETPTGQKLSVQPDGNSFDMMQNLISLKTR